MIVLLIGNYRRELRYKRKTFNAIDTLLLIPTILSPTM